MLKIPAALVGGLLSLGLLLPSLGHSETSESLKEAAVASVEQQSQKLSDMSDQIWSFAEIALNESHSVKVLADYATEQGFEVQRGVAGLPTAFIASYGSGRPIIGVLGEFDALPRLSQAAAPERQTLVEDAPGHGCGHNLFGSASLGAATAIKRLIEAGRIQGTIRFYGTPAEESIGGKIYMAREGLFDDLDVALSWHPNDTSKMDVSGSQAMVETIVAFKGKSSHAAFDPWMGNSALDGLELFTHSLNLMREHVRPSVRIHYSIIDGGGAPNVVPATASAAVWIRDTKLADVIPLYERMQTMATATATAAQVIATVQLLSGTYDILQNREAAKLVHANMLRLGDITYDDADTAFAKRLQNAMGVPEIGLNGRAEPLDLVPTEQTGGSTDVADVSWIVPTVDVNIATAPLGIPWHSWGVVAASRSEFAHKGMHYAAKVLATTAVDLFTSPDSIAAIKAEFVQSTNGFSYSAYIPDGPPPIPE
ncbi:MAG: aminobenzoyl-glutamate utilization protein B [Halieaceae bacterium]|jgi:aminobenzoyl-glutamate utilization protein B